MDNIIFNIIGQITNSRTHRILQSDSRQPWYRRHYTSCTYLDILNNKLFANNQSLQVSSIIPIFSNILQIFGHSTDGIIYTTQYSIKINLIQPNFCITKGRKVNQQYHVNKYFFEHHQRNSNPYLFQNSPSLSNIKPYIETTNLKFSDEHNFTVSINNIKLSYYFDKKNIKYFTIELKGNNNVYKIVKKQDGYPLIFKEEDYWILETTKTFKYCEKKIQKVQERVLIMDMEINKLIEIGDHVYHKYFLNVLNSRNITLSAISIPHEEYIHKISSLDSNDIFKLLHLPLYNSNPIEEISLKEYNKLIFINEERKKNVLDLD